MSDPARRDECFIGLAMDAILTGAGAEIVGPVRDVESAMAEARRDGFELAVLDVRINGGLTFDIADELVRQGVPFVFTTGYDLSVIPGRFAGVRCWIKPINQKDLVRGLAKLYREALIGGPDISFADRPEPRAH